MENNEIYIDGVNVAGCEFFDYECSAYRQEYWESEDNTKDMCSSHPNCYFKQFKRLEQENKELKERLNGCLNSYGELYGTTNTLAFEHAKYRSALEEIRTHLNTLSSIDNDFPNTETYLRIQDKINEVLTP